MLGVDPAGAGREWRQRIGIVLQDSRHAARSSLCASRSRSSPATTATPRGVDETIELVGLTDKADDRSPGCPAGSSGGWTSALALIGDPELLFLDEPTTGFDPSARRQAWEVIASLRELGKTVFLTTHYMDEAQALADRVAIIAGGEIVAEGAPGRARRPRRRALITFRLPTGWAPASFPARWRRRCGAAAPHPNGQVQLRTDDPVAILKRSRAGLWRVTSTWRSSRFAGRASRTCTWS